METIFEHNLTEQEMIDIFGTTSVTKDMILGLGMTQTQHYAKIYRLYWNRGDREKAIEYAKKIPDSIWKIFEVCNHDI